MNVDDRSLDVEVSEEEMEVRRKSWQPPVSRYQRGVLAKYAKLVGSASTGAVTS